MIAAFLILQFLDALTTTAAIEQGAHEGNPTIAWLIDNHPWVTVPAKALVLLPVAFAWLWLRKHSPRGAKFVICFGILAGCWAVFNNSLVILHA